MRIPTAWSMTLLDIIASASWLCTCTWRICRKLTVSAATHCAANASA
jgi:hypothetical protein